MRVRGWGAVAGGLLIIAALLPVAGCASAQRGSMAEADAAEVIERFNARAARLERVWARAVVQFEYTDEDGDRNREQGEGHLQLRQPSEFALSVGKLGEVLFWLGADAERFWWFDLAEGERASVGLHANVGLPCARSPDMGVHPLDLVDLLGVTPLPPDAAVRRAAEGGGFIVEAPGRAGVRRLTLEPVNLEPIRVELASGAGAPAFIAADLSRHDRVRLTRTGGGYPSMATHVEIDHAETGTEILLSLSDMSDGERGRLGDDNFSFAALLDVFAPATVIDLDEGCGSPAWPRESQAAR